MGLSIAYQLRLPAATPPVVVRDLLTRAAEHARVLGCPEVRGPLPISRDNRIGERIINVPHCRPVWVLPDAGWLVSADIGKMCESLEFAFFRHPPEVLHNYHGTVRTGLPANWHFDGWCKTGYAANVGWEHLLACHQRVLALLRFLRRQGVKVSIQDEGGYYPRKDETGLRRWMGLPVPPPAAPPPPRRERKPEPAALAQPAVVPDVLPRRPKLRPNAVGFCPAGLLLQDGFPFTR